MAPKLQKQRKTKRWKDDSIVFEDTLLTEVHTTVSIFRKLCKHACAPCISDNNKPTQLPKAGSVAHDIDTAFEML